MANEERIFTFSGLACSDLSSSQFRAVRLSTASGIAISGATDPAIGVLQNNPTAGKVGSYATIGQTKAEAGGVVAVGDWIGPGASGKLVKKTPRDTNVAAGTVGTFETALGQARTPAAADGVIFSLMLTGAHSVQVA